jgi:hypothetical protein
MNNKDILPLLCEQGDGHDCHCTRGRERGLEKQTLPEYSLFACSACQGLEASEAGTSRTESAGKQRTLLLQELCMKVKLQGYVHKMAQSTNRTMYEGVYTSSG